MAGSSPPAAPTSPTAHRSNVTPEQAQLALRVFARELAVAAVETRAAGLEVPSSLDRRLDALAERIGLRPEVPIALVGGTGSGKSTLINALLSAYVLPISSTFACTSAVTEIAWSDRGYYSVDVELLSRDEWAEELDLLERDLADTRVPGNEQGSVSKPAEDKLRAIYGDEAAARYLASLDRAELVEPAPIRAVFERGRQIVESEEVGWFRQQLGTYLTSAHPFWPLVRRARIEGPFDLLREGAVLVDLPGLNDPNQAREATTRAYIRSARFVWVVFKMDRALTRDVFELLGDGGLLSRLYMEGRTASVRLVGTGSDQINPLSDIGAFGLPENATERDIVLARSRAVGEYVRGQLRELGLAIGREARAEPAEIAQLCDQLDGVPIHCVSAVDYHKCIGLDRPTRQVLTAVEDTGIPDLQEATFRQLAEFGQRAHLEQINEELWAIRDELEQLLGAASARLDVAASLRDDRQADRTAPSDDGEPVVRSLETRTQRAVDRFDQAMARAGDVLRQRLADAGSEAERDVAELDAIWRTMHLSTMRAVLRRGGVWADRDRAIDINRQIARPLLDRIPFAWAEFFGHRAIVALESLTGDLQQAMDDFLDEMGPVLAGHPRHGSTGAAHAVNAVRHLVENDLRTMQRAMSERLEADRRRIDEEIREAVRRGMSPTYEAMLTVTGSGAREKMVDLLATGAADASKAMHNELTAVVADLLGSLTADLRREAGVVALRLGDEADSLVTSGAPLVSGVPSTAGTDPRHGAEILRLLSGLPELRLGS